MVLKVVRDDDLVALTRTVAVLKGRRQSSRARWPLPLNRTVAVLKARWARHDLHGRAALNRTVVVFPSLTENSTMHDSARVVQECHREDRP